MSATATRPMTSAGNQKFSRTLKIAGWSAMLLVAIAFVGKYVFRYYLNYNAAAFNDPVLGAPNYWAMRGWLLMHMTGGMAAVLTGPFQFWTGFRMKYAAIHRTMGKIFLIGVLVGTCGAVMMAVNTTFGWAFGVSLIAMATAWFSTSAMAYYAILKRRIPVHKEWMARAYVVTFAFVTFRVLSDYSPMRRLEPANDRFLTISWASWAIPLLAAEIIIQLRKMRTASAG